MIRISIIIPVYNAASYLSECLDSILSQVDESCEVICVDDGSTDGSYEILKKYASIRVIRKPNGGVSSARNRGMKEARGKYLWFVDADDIIVRGAISYLADLLRTNTPDILTFKWFRFKNGEKIPKVSSGNVSYFSMFVREQAVFALKRLGGLLWAYNAIYRKESLGGLRFEDFSNGEDMLFGYGAIFNAKSIVATDSILYGYRDNPVGASKTRSARHLRSIMQVALRLNEMFRANLHSDWFERYRIKHINGIMHTWGIIIADKLGAKGYDIWRETAIKLYGRGLLRLLIAIKWNFGIWCSTIGVIKVKQAMLRVVR